MKNKNTLKIFGIAFVLNIIADLINLALNGVSITKTSIVITLLITIIFALILNQMDIIKD